MENGFFKKIKVRWLLFWIIISFMFLTFLDYLNKVTGFIGDREFSIFIQIALYLAMLIWLIFSFKKNDISLKRLFLNNDKERFSLGYYILLQLILVVLSLSIMTVLISSICVLDGSIVYQFLSSQNNSSPDYTLTFPNLFITIILAPAVEETLFRGYLFSKWGEAIGVKKAIILSSLVFGILHIIEGGFLAQFFLGVLWCLVYMKTKNLFIPIGLHMLHNGLTLLSLYLLQLTNQGGVKGLDLASVTEAFKVMGLIGLVFMIILLPISLLLLRGLYKHNTNTVPYLSNS
jgi:uncharacterized protein